MESVIGVGEPNETNETLDDLIDQQEADKAFMKALDDRPRPAHFRERF
jgi:hypothetical protein